MPTTDTDARVPGPTLLVACSGPVVRVTFGGAWRLDALPGVGNSLREATDKAAAALMELKSVPVLVQPEPSVPQPQTLPTLTPPTVPLNTRQASRIQGTQTSRTQTSQTQTSVPAASTPPTLELCIQDLTEWDTSLLVPTVRLVALARERHITIHDEALPQGLRSLIRLALAIPARPGSAKGGRKKGSWLERLADFTLALPHAVSDVLAFIGELVLSVGRLFWGKSACTGTNVWLALQEASIGALPIVSLISLLVGLILAFVGVIQLGMFGAEVYVSSLVAVSMTRIMGAIMTGIILSGRTGAAYAAVLGTMQVNEEIDALSTLGVAPSDYLVLPRVIALTLITPLLIVYADAMGILGGFVVGVGALGLDPMEYLSFTQKGFMISNLWVGMAHGLVFGLVISITGCYQGLRCGRNAEAVGQATTAAVVCSIVGIVLATAVLTLIFNVLQI